jgi:hypothetical protein
MHHTSHWTRLSISTSNVRVVVASTGNRVQEGSLPVNNDWMTLLYDSMT